MASDRWQPREFIRFEENYTTSTHPARIITDEGPAYIKAINNPIGPHALAREFLGTSLARWIGLETFDFAIMEILEGDEIPLADGKTAAPGNAFATRAVEGFPWDGESTELGLLENPGAVSLLVTFDTWTLNSDRHPPASRKRRPNPDNVFFSFEGASPGRFRLVAFDHSECFGGSGEDLGRRVATIDRIKDPGIYGLFPEFAKRLDGSVIQAAATQLGCFDRSNMDALIDDIPADWQISMAAKEALCKFAVERAHYLSDNFVKNLNHACGRLNL